MARESKKLEKAMAEAMALGNSGQNVDGVRQCGDSSCWFCYPQNAEMPIATVNFEPAEEPVNPFKVIADWFRGNPAPSEPPTFFDKLNLGGMVLPPEFFKFERDEDEQIVPLYTDTEREESNFVTTSAEPRCWLINPRTGEQTEIPIQSFELGGFIPRDSTLARVLMDEVERQSEAVEKMDSILRDAPIEKPLLRTHFSRRMLDGRNRIVLNPFHYDIDGRVSVREPLVFELDDAITLRDNLTAEIEAAEDDFS